jgi:hypothetical protein
VTATDDCDFQPLLSPFHDGTLPAPRAYEVERHVMSCRTCAGELAHIRRVSEVFAMAPRRAPPQRLLEGLYRLGAVPRKRPAHLRFVMGAGAIAAIVCICATARLAYLRVYQPGRPASGGVPYTPAEAPTEGPVTRPVPATDRGPEFAPNAPPGREQ